MKQIPISQTKKQSKMKNILMNKGFYILLTLLVVAVAITGYVSNQRAQITSKLSGSGLSQPGVKVSLQDPPMGEIIPPPSPDSRRDIPARAAQAQVPEPMEITDEPKEVSFTMPMAGEWSVPYSGENLIYNKTLEDWRTHAGIDFPGSIGTQVKAVADGTVEDVFLDEMLGTVIVLRHSEEFSTRYCNLQSEALVKKGQAVQMGNVIGGIGHSAASEIADPPHLHFELLKDGIPVDPLEYIEE